MDDREFDYLIARIDDVLGLQLQQYKPSQLRRRLNTFRERGGFANARALVEQLDSDEELAAPSWTGSPST